MLGNERQCKSTRFFFVTDRKSIEMQTAYNISSPIHILERYERPRVSDEDIYGSTEPAYNAMNSKTGCTRNCLSSCLPFS